MEGTWSLLRSWLRLHCGISQERLPANVSFFQFVHNTHTKDARKNNLSKLVLCENVKYCIIPIMERAVLIQSIRNKYENIQSVLHERGKAIDDHGGCRRQSWPSNEVVEGFVTGVIERFEVEYYGLPFSSRYKPKVSTHLL